MIFILIRLECLKENYVPVRTAEDSGPVFGENLVDLSKMNSPDVKKKLKEKKKERKKICSLQLNYVNLLDLLTYLAGCLRHCEVEYLSIADCNLKDSSVSDLVFARSLKGTMGRLQLKSICLSHNKIQDKGFNRLRFLFVACASDLEAIECSNCGLKGNINFGVGVDKKIKHLDLSYNMIEVANMQTICEIIDRHKVYSLHLNACGLSSHHLKIMKRTLVTSVKEINLGENRDMDVQDVAELVSQWGIEKINLSDCFLLRDDISRFAAALGRYKLKELIFGESYETLSEEKADELLKINCEKLTPRCRKPGNADTLIKWRELRSGTQF